MCINYKKAARILTGADRLSQPKPLFENLNWMPLTERILYHTAVLTCKAKNFMTGQRMVMMIVEL